MAEEAPEPFSVAVGRVREELTDGVSAFSLFVASMKKMNAKVPRDIAAKVRGMSGPCSIVVDFAYQVALQYEEFITIKGAIEGDARALDAACNNMVAACDASQHEIIASAANRSKYWQRMADSCSAIAEAVMSILERLGDAEMDRLLEYGEEILTIVAEAEEVHGEYVTDVEKDESFMNGAKKVADACAQLAEYAAAKAEGEEGPALQEFLGSLTQKSQSLADDVIRITNDRLQDHADEKSQGEFTSSMSEVRCMVQEMRRELRANRERSICRSAPPSEAEHPVTEDASEDILQAPAPEPEEQPKAESKPTPEAEPTPEAKSTEKEKSTPEAEPTPVAEAAESRTADPVSVESWAPQSMKEIAEFTEQLGSESAGGGVSDDLRELIQQLVVAAVAGDAATLLEVVRKIAALAKSFAGEARSAAKAEQRVHYKDRMILCAASLRDICQQLRIVASVKINSDEGNLDRDEQLVFLTSSLIKMWKETSDTIEIARLDKSSKRPPKHVVR